MLVLLVLVLVLVLVLLVSGAATTSWKPAKTLPPIKYSHCFPACTSKHPSVTLTATFRPSRRQTNSPGNLLR